MTTDLFDLQIHVSRQQTFFLNEKIISKYSGKLRKIIKQEKRRTQIRNSGIEIDEFPGGPDGFELVSRFCYNHGTISITVSNVSLLHCCALFLGMTEKVSPCNLLEQTETFLEGMFYWSWSEILISLKSCESFFLYADSSGLVQKLMFSLLAKIAQNSDVNGFFASSSSSSSFSSDTASGFRLSSSAKATPDYRKAWWFDEMTILPPVIVESFVKSLGGYGSENNSLVLTRFLLHYLKTAAQSKGVNNNFNPSDYGGLADTAVYGVILLGKSAFSCRGLFWVLRIVSGFGLSRDCRNGLERLIGGMLDLATLDDLLVSGHNGGVYDVNLVLRLIKVFVHSFESNSDNKKGCGRQMSKVGRLIDRYLGEIAPDHSLKISKFLAVATSLADCARNCFDGVYRAIDIYLESHPTLSLEERSRLCRCLKYEKLSLEACKDLAKNPRIPPRIAVQALASQHPNIACNSSDQYAIITTHDRESASPMITSSGNQISAVYSNGKVVDTESSSISEEENDDMKLNLQRMRWRVVELEKVCREMKGQMSKMVRTGVVVPPGQHRALPRLC
ncbi:hypothetical protein RJ640_023433 [Escallonia rubra]|uniref:NPH3 domain-containing protein n=1 Tax=Escallonia rubra TaxID=112253 RepID=A0AA88UED6_9ASTE|nr:hypothetical protein RJ640_023433 [Escallonia rubra]